MSEGATDVFEVEPPAEFGEYKDEDEDEEIVEDEEEEIEEVTWRFERAGLRYKLPAELKEPEVPLESGNGGDIDRFGW